MRGLLWKAECIERCPLGLGKDGWKRTKGQSTGTETVRFNHSRQPFWRPGNALAIYFMKLKGQEANYINCKQSK